MCEYPVDLTAAMVPIPLLWAPNVSVAEISISPLVTPAPAPQMITRTTLTTNYQDPIGPPGYTKNHVDKINHFIQLLWKIQINPLM